MKTCMMCGTNKEDVTMAQVSPATWNGFNNFAEVCAECQATPRFKTGARAASGKAKAGAARAAAAATVEDAAPAKATIQITHRRTGVLLHTVESHTLAGASLAGASLSGADLQHAAMRGADLRKADLHLADLAGADLRGADLRAANCRGADLRGTDLREARLTGADLKYCLYDDGTRWPAGYDPRTSGAVWGTRHS